MIVCISVQEHVAFISEEDLKNPHIRHFDHLNPGWDKVHSYVWLQTCFIHTFTHTSEVYSYIIYCMSLSGPHCSPHYSDFMHLIVNCNDVFAFNCYLNKDFLSSLQQFPLKM